VSVRYQVAVPLPRYTLEFYEDERPANACDHQSTGGSAALVAGAAKQQRQHNGLGHHGFI
jgi:hypothetical protein